MIPQKFKLPMNFLETFPGCSLPSTVSKDTIKMKITMPAYEMSLANLTQFMPVLVLITRVIYRSKLYFAAAGRVIC